MDSVTKWILTILGWIGFTVFLGLLARIHFELVIIGWKAFG